MADYQVWPTEQVGVESSIVLWSPTVTSEAGAEASLIYIAPALPTASVGVTASLVVGRLITEPLTESVGAEASVIVTLPADSRTTWVSTVDTAADECHEIKPFVRGKAVQALDYGTVTFYSRQFTVPRGNHGQAALETVLAPGAHMKTIWADGWFSLALDGPKALPVAKVEQFVTAGAATGKDAVQVTFAAIKTLEPVGTGYSATARRLVSSDAYGKVYVEWGIAPSLSAAGVPVPGTILKGYGGVYAPKCVMVDPSDLTLPGRWLIKSIYHQKLEASTYHVRPEYVEDVYTDSGHVTVRRRAIVRRTGGGISMGSEL
jgi:hypothetical protein